jgi:N-acetylneuraminate synthase
MNIAGRLVGPGNPCFVIAEIAQAHDGSLGAAHAYVDAAARAGADAVKFQTHLADQESSPAEPWRVPFSRQDASRFDYWRRMEFSREQWAGLAAHARERGLVFLSSAFSEAAVDLLEALDLPAWKVGSGEVTNHRLLRRMSRGGRPVLLSSGMSDWNDLDHAVAVVRQTGAPLAVFQCTSAYPCPPERVGLNLLAELRDRYGVPVGLSDHSARVETGLAARTLGADLLEVHLVFSRECFGPDTPSSLTVDELARLVSGVRYLEAVLRSPVDKAALARELAPLRATFGKSVATVRALPAGHVLGPDDVGLRKPGTGLPPARLEEVIGRTLQVEVPALHLLQESDLV